MISMGGGRGVWTSSSGSSSPPLCIPETVALEREPATLLWNRCRETTTTAENPNPRAHLIDDVILQVRVRLSQLPWLSRRTGLVSHFLSVFPERFGPGELDCSEPSDGCGCRLVTDSVFPSEPLTGVQRGRWATDRPRPLIGCCVVRTSITARLPFYDVLRLQVCPDALKLNHFLPRGATDNSLTPDQYRGPRRCFLPFPEPKKQSISTLERECDTQSAEQGTRPSWGGLRSVVRTRHQPGRSLGRSNSSTVWPGGG
ncbi:hypothetical protein EYF80_038773 [Liparis tanakae]|uniref:Uncharacterized protein n=1 Tax=Liparis tanakae TaxID=230148 RepID=A0A4Z2GDR3_9TELE|nr:hypothetical protein EYF80_038773 [Liparis tanakae]